MISVLLSKGWESYLAHRFDLVHLLLRHAHRVADHHTSLGRCVCEGFHGENKHAAACSQILANVTVLMNERGKRLSSDMAIPVWVVVDRHRRVLLPQLIGHPETSQDGANPSCLLAHLTGCWFWCCRGLGTSVRVRLAHLNQQITRNRVIIFSLSWSPYRRMQINI